MFFFRFWKNPDSFRFEKTETMMAYDPRSEKAKLYMRRLNKDMTYTKVVVNFEEIGPLLDEAERFLLEIDNTQFDQLVPSLMAAGKYASMDPSNSEFWDFCWQGPAKGIRIRPFINEKKEYALVVNNPVELTDSEKFKYKDKWHGPKVSDT